MLKKVLLTYVAMFTHSYCLAISTNSDEDKLNKCLDFNENYIQQEQFSHYLNEVYVVLKKLFSDE
jgi:hypothetical protein